MIKEKRVVAVIPVHGRRALTAITIKRLLTKNGVSHVICVGESADRDACIAAGAEWINHPNILGAKWNAGYLAARDMHPDAVLFVGSSDWISDEWLQFMMPLLAHAGMVGKLEYCQAHIQKDGRIRAGMWMGYRGEREYEPIGIGRVLSAKALDSIDWQPFRDEAMRGMDYSMYHKLLVAGNQVAMCHNTETRSLSVSTERWSNLHQFGETQNSKGFVEFNDPHGFMSALFPEIYELREILKDE